MNAGGFKGFLLAHLRQYAEQAARQHGLAGARGTNQQQIVAASRGDLQRALGQLLAAHLGEIQVKHRFVQAFLIGLLRLSRDGVLTG